MTVSDTSAQPSPTPTPIEWLRSHPAAADALLAVALAALLLAFPRSDRARDRFAEQSWGWAALTLAQTLPLALRRRHPVPIFFIVGVATIFSSSLDYATTGLGPLVGMYTVAAHGVRRTSLSLLGVSLGGAAISQYLGPGPHRAGDAIGTTVIFVTAWALGDSLQSQRRYVAGLEERADRLEREREEQARRAVAEERTRIARELHDIIAHHVSVMVVQAGAARRILGRDADSADEALATVEGTGRQALSELRAMLGVLRSENEGEAEAEGRSPQPGVSNVRSLIEQVTDTGLDVEYEVEGELAPLPPAIDLAVYRIAQEALTNVLKHAGPAARARVAVAYETDGVRIEVTDDGRGAAAHPPEGGGHGIIGMRERSAFLGGTFRAGPRSGPGWAVVARFPFDREIT